MLNLHSGPKKNHKKGIGRAIKDERRKDAEARQQSYNLLSTDQKIAKLDAGGYAATRQRYNLLLKKVAEKVKDKSK